LPKHGEGKMVSFSVCQSFFNLSLMSDYWQLYMSSHY
jgi:hypothetical protein